MPLLTIFAGPNGSGKSSIILRSQFTGKSNLLEADAIAKRLRPDDPKQAGIAAGREVIHKTYALISAGHDFAIETTLAGNWTGEAIRSAHDRHYFVRLIYIGVDDPERSIQRVRERAAQGGHAVPDADIRRRYARSLLNLQRIATKVDQALIYDNSGQEPTLLLELRSGTRAVSSSEIPEWARPLLP